MKSIIIIILQLPFIFNYFLFASETKKVNEYVKVEITLKLKAIKPGETGELQIKFKPKKDIHINFNPPITIKIDSNDVISVLGKLDIPKPTKEGYVDITKPIKQKFILAKHTKLDNVRLTGMLSYFYCSGTDGWCSRFKQPFECDIKIK